MKKLKSLTKFKIKSLNQEKKLNALSKIVKLYNIDRLDKNLTTFEVDDNNFKVAKKFLINNNIEILEVEGRGFGKYLKLLLSNWGVLVSGIILAIAYTVQYQCIWKIEIDGTEVLSTDEISTFVNENLTSKFKSSIDTKALEIKLKSQYERISAVSVAIIGQTLVVNISEAYIPDEMGDNFKPIVSNYSGIITKIELIQGTLKVKQGDIVRAGDVLVEPFIIDTDGEKRDVKPEAYIQADIWIFGESEHCENSRRIERTGEKSEYSEVYLFGLKIYSNVKENKFEKFDSEVRESDLTKNMILPIKVKHYTYYETREIIENNKFEEVKEKKIEEARQNALIYLEESEIIKDENFTIRSVGGVTNVTYILTVSREIGG